MDKRAWKNLLTLQLIFAVIVGLIGIALLGFVVLSNPQNSPTGFYMLVLFFGGYCGLITALIYGFDSPKSERRIRMEIEQQKIIDYLADKEEGGTSNDIAKAVFNEAPSYRQVDQTYALKFFDKLEAMLEDMLKEGKLVSEGERF